MNSNSIRLDGRYYREYPPHEPLGHATESLSLNLERTAFMLIDVYGQQHEPGVDVGELPEFYRPGDPDIKGEIIREKIIPAKRAAKEVGLRRVYVTNYLSPGLSEGTEWRNMSMRTCGVDVLKEWQPPTPILNHMESIAPEPDEPVVKKQYYSGFHETHLDSLLRGWNTRNLVVVGFDSRVCLGTTVVDAMYRNYRVIVLRDATSTSEYPETRDGNLANLMAIREIEGKVGYTVTTEEFIQACESLAEDRGSGSVSST